MEDGICDLSINFSHTENEPKIRIIAILRYLLQLTGSDSVLNYDFQC